MVKNLHVLFCCRYYIQELIIYVLQQDNWKYEFSRNFLSSNLFPILKFTLCGTVNSIKDIIFIYGYFLSHIHVKGNIFFCLPSLVVIVALPIYAKGPGLCVT